MDRLTEKVSYLHAKDQTIVILSRANLQNCRVNLESEMLKENSVESSDDKHIPVYLRIKGGLIDMDLYEIQEQSLICKVPEGSYSFRNLKSGDVMTRTYKFSKIFGPDTTQIDIFNSIVKSKILDFINGKNCTLFTYGTTGSGKTFTIVGTPVEPGIIPRALEYIFRTIPQLSDHPEAMPLPNGGVVFLNEQEILAEVSKKVAILKAIQNEKNSHTKTYCQMQKRLSSEPVGQIEDFSNVSVSIWVSFAEIYNECVFDLLQPLPKNRIRPKLRLGHCNGQIYIKNLTSVCVHNGLEAYQIHQYGIQNLNYAATALNSHSSRSHAIFTIRLLQSTKINGETRVSCLRFCDLAGSERSKKTLNIGERLKESNNINRSLLVLGRCIEGVRTLQQSKDNHLVPFRDSKLTQIFQYALLGQENIAMIVNLNPSKSMFEESHHALNFSAITKDIIIEEKPVIEIKPMNRFSELMRQKDQPFSKPIVQQKPQEVDLEKDEKIDKLQNMVMNLYSEIETMKEEFDKEVLEEKHEVANMYKKYISEIRAEHEEELTRRLKSQSDYYESQMDRLRTLLNEANTNNVINISDSSTDDSKSFIEAEIEDRQEVRQLKETNMSLKMKIEELNKEIKELNKEIEKLKREPQQKFTSKHLEYEQLLTDAKVAFADLEKENKIYKTEMKKLLSENILLKEQYEQLNVISFGGSVHTSEPDEDTHYSGLPGLPLNTLQISNFNL